MTFKLEIDAYGTLNVIDDTGIRHTNVRPVRTFPISDPNAGLSLMSPDGKELAWFESIDSIDTAYKEMILQGLAQTEFMPTILRITKVSSFATPSIWDITTDRGDTRLKLKGEEDIRRITRETLLITDAHGIQYLIRNTNELDKGSRKILDRFL
jgi:hypothetical protein